MAKVLTAPSSTPSSAAAAESSPTPSGLSPRLERFRRLVEAGPPPMLPEPDEKDLPTG